MYAWRRLQIGTLVCLENVYYGDHKRRRRDGSGINVVYVHLCVFASVRHLRINGRERGAPTLRRMDNNQNIRGPMRKNNNMTHIHSRTIVLRN